HNQRGRLNTQLFTTVGFKGAHGFNGGPQVVVSQRLTAAVGQLPETEAHVAAAIHAAAALVGHKDLFIVQLGHGHHVGGAAGLQDQRLNGAAGVEQIPGGTAAGVVVPVADQFGGAGTIDVRVHRVFGIKEVLAVVAQRGGAG